MATTLKTGNSLTGHQNVEDFAALVNTPAYRSNGVPSLSGDETNAGAIVIFGENDNGSITGIREVLSPETDDDYRQRVAHDTLLDWEEFDYTLQNTKKHTFTSSTLAATITTAGITTNSGNINTTNTGLTFGTHAMFPAHPNQTLVCETSVAFTAQPTANVVVDFGMFLRGASTAFAPIDGVYFRLSSAGLIGVSNYAGVEQTTSVFPNALGTGTFTYLNNSINKFLIQVTNVRTSFWVNNTKVGELPTPITQNMPFASQVLPFSFRHANIGTTGDNTFKALFKGYQIGTRGTLYSDSLSTVTSRIVGTYQTLSGTAPAQLVAGTVTSGTLVKPTAAIPVNTSLVANLPNSLAGRIYEQLASGLAANIDGIFASYTVSAGTTVIPGRRLKVTGIKLSGMVSTVVVGGGAFTEWYIAFGHTSDTLATAESASMASGTTKSPVRVLLPELTSNMLAAQAAGTLLVQPAYSASFDNPIYVNPGERIALVGNKTITSAITSGILSYTYQFDYSWE